MRLWFHVREHIQISHIHLSERTQVVCCNDYTILELSRKHRSTSDDRTLSVLVRAGGLEV